MPRPVGRGIRRSCGLGRRQYALVVTHRSLKTIAAVLVLTALATGTVACTPTPSASPTPSISSESSTPTVAPTGTSTPTPAAAQHTVALSVDGIRIDGGELLPRNAPDQTLSALEELLEERPEREQPDGAYDIVFYRWGSLSASVSSGSTVSLSFGPSEVPGLTVVLESGVGLGSTRDEAMATGAVPGWDEDGDGVADYLSIERREVPGTNSLSRPGEVGVEYIELKIVDDIVTGVGNGGNDFSDL